MNGTTPHNFVCVPIDEGLYRKLAVRTPDSGIRHLLENIAWDYLERTADDAESPRHEAPGITWGPLSLPVGTRLMMEYQGRQHVATVEPGGIVFADQRFDSPSRLARAIANNTSRNAWRDLWVRRPRDKDWQPAELLRKRVERIAPMDDLKELFED